MQVSKKKDELSIKSKHFNRLYVQSVILDTNLCVIKKIIFIIRYYEQSPDQNYINLFFKLSLIYSEIR